MTPRQIARVDRNQEEIVAALRGIGCSVLHLHTVGHGCPDILVGKFGRNILIEIKAEDGELTEDERKFFERWYGQVTIVRTVEDALRLLEDMEA